MATLRKQLLEALDHLLRFGLEAGTGDADHLDVDQLKILLASTIALERSATAMRLIDVEFDGEALWLPIGVELVLAFVEVHRRWRQAGASDQIPEAALKARAGERGVGTVDSESPAKAAGTPVSLHPPKQLIHRAQVEQTALFAALQGAFEPSGRQHRSEIKQGARDGSDGIALADGDVTHSQAREVQTKSALGMTTGRRRDMERP